MAFRFRKSIKLFPGLKINFSKKGASLSLGAKGASVNLSAKGARATVGVPGTGMSYSESISAASIRNGDFVGSKKGSKAYVFWALLLIVCAVWAFYKFYS